MWWWHGDIVTMPSPYITTTPDAYMYLLDRQNICRCNIDRVRSKQPQVILIRWLLPFVFVYSPSAVVLVRNCRGIGLKCIIWIHGQNIHRCNIDHMSIGTRYWYAIIGVWTGPLIFLKLMFRMIWIESLIIICMFLIFWIELKGINSMTWWVASICYRLHVSNSASFMYILSVQNSNLSSRKPGTSFLVQCFGLFFFFCQIPKITQAKV